jgi:hypothetical protein
MEHSVGLKTSFRQETVHGTVTARCGKCGFNKRVQEIVMVAVEYENNERTFNGVQAMQQGVIQARQQAFNSSELTDAISEHNQRCNGGIHYQ